MGITFDADDPRTIKALELAAEADHWLTGRNRAGQGVFGVPSQRDPDRYYIVTSATCDCPDYLRQTDLTLEPQPCKHMLAVRLHCELVRAQQQRTQRPPERRANHLQIVPRPSLREHE